MDKTEIRSNLIFLISVIAGLPQQDASYAYYNEQEYMEGYDYDGSGLVDNAAVNEAVEASHDPLVTHRPAITSKGAELDVDNGMTIRLPCIVDKLPGDDFTSLLLSECKGYCYCCR